jgi:hypothetical protein
VVDQFFSDNLLKYFGDRTQERDWSIIVAVQLITRLKNGNNTTLLKFGRKLASGEAQVKDVS